MNNEKAKECLQRFSEKCEYENGFYDFRKGCRSKFLPVLTSVIRITRVSDMWIQTQLEITVCFSTDQYTVKGLKLDDLKHVDFQLDVDSRCYVEDKQTRECLIDFIMYQLSRIDDDQIQNIYSLDKLGYAYINGMVVYNAGSRIIGAKGIKVISDASLKKYSLVKDRSIPSEKLNARINQMIQLNDGITPILFSYLILALLREPFHKAGVPIRFCMYLLGESQSFKTTLATYYCSIYNRDTDVECWLHNLTATETALMSILDKEKDCISIIDDLNKSDSKSQERLQEAKISALIRVAANDVGKETIRNQKEVNSQVLFCGEYPLKNISTNNRLIVLFLKQGMIDSKKLLKVEEKPVFLSTFADSFIQWVLKNYERVCDDIRCSYEDFIQNRANDPGYQERLNRSAGILSVAYQIFLNYCKDNSWNVYLSKEQYEMILVNVIRDQIEYLQLDAPEEEDCIAKLYEALRYEMNADNVINTRPNYCWENLIYHNTGNDCIYIPGSKLDEMICDFCCKKSKLELVNSFEKVGILCVDRNKNHTRTKKLAGKRCYVFRYDIWTEYVKGLKEQGD